MYRGLIVLGACLAFLIIVIGAFVRLSDAGLGCPDWPGCYGRLTVPDEAHELAAAQQQFPGKPVQLQKAWIEMLHRYLAASLGVVILVVAAIAWRRRDSGQFPALPAALVGLVVLQGLLGMWTVTLSLQPGIVTLHLLGGMTTLALLVWLASRQFPRREAEGIIVLDRPLSHARLGLALLAVQIGLGGWVSSNYAGLACTDLPQCQGSWLPRMNFGDGFRFVHELGLTVSLDALTAIHWAHRVGALVTFLVLMALALRLARTPGFMGFAGALAVVLSLQVGLGLTIVWLSLPLPLAVAHNAGAALLLSLLVLINFRLTRTTPQGSSDDTRLRAAAYR